MLITNESSFHCCFYDPYPKATTRMTSPPGTPSTYLLSTGLMLEAGSSTWSEAGWRRWEHLSIWVFEYLTIWVFEAGWGESIRFNISLDHDFTRCTSTSTTSRGTWATLTTWRRAARAPGLRRWSTARTAGTGPGRWEKPHQPDLSSSVPGKKLPNYLLRRWSCLQETWATWLSMRSVISLASPTRQTSRQLCIQRYGFPTSKNPAAIFWNLLRKYFFVLWPHV